MKYSKCAMGGITGTGKKINAKSKVSLHLAGAIQEIENYIKDLKSERISNRQIKAEKLRNFQESLKDMSIYFVENF